MNKIRRKQLQQAIELMEQAKAILEDVRDQEQESFDNMPEGLQCSERGETMEETIYNLDEAFGTIEDMVETLEGM